MAAEFWCPATKAACERHDCVGAVCRLQGNFCPLAKHYTECPRFRKSCDAINCEARFSWKELAVLREVRRGG